MASSITTLLDGIYLLAGLAVLALIAMFVARRTAFSRGAMHLAVTFGSAILLDLPYRTYLLDELVNAVSARQAMNGLADFAYSPRVFDWAFWGSLLTNDAGIRKIINMGLTLAAIGMLMLGLYGLIHLLVEKHMAEGLTFCALAFSPIVFLIGNGDCRYAFYKMVTFAIPLVSFGAWSFGDLCLDKLETSFFLEPANRAERLLRRLAKPAVSIVLCGAFTLSAGCSVRRINRVIKCQSEGGKTSGGYLTYVEAGMINFQPDYTALYSELEGISGEDLLIIDTENSLPYCWMIYYARDNAIYSLTEEIDDVIAFGRDDARTHCENIPLDSRIVWSPRTYNMVTDPEKQDDFAAVLQTRTNVHTVVSQLEVPTDNCFRLCAFARNAAEAELVLSVQSADPSGQPAELYFQSGAYTVEAGTVTQLHIPLKLSAGGQMVEFTSSADVAISSWVLSIGEVDA